MTAETEERCSRCGTTDRELHTDALTGRVYCLGCYVKLPEPPPPPRLDVGRARSLGRRPAAPARPTPVIEALDGRRYESLDALIAAARLDLGFRQGSAAAQKRR